MAIKRGTKSVLKEYNKDISVREASRMAQNERRKAERRLAREIEQETGYRPSRKEAYSYYQEHKSEIKSPQAKSLAANIRGLQARKIPGTKATKGYGVEIGQVQETLLAYTQSKYGTETLAGSSKAFKNQKPEQVLMRQNKMFERQLNQSTKKGGLSILNMEETKSFYAATQDIWYGETSSGNYNADIMRKFGLNKLEDVYNLLTKETLKKEDFGFTDEKVFQEWLKEIDERTQLLKRREIMQQELRNIRNARKHGGTTDDEEYNGEEEKDKEGSPDYINRIVTRIATALYS